MRRSLTGNVAEGAADRADYAVDMLSGCSGCRARGQGEKGKQKGAGQFHMCFFD